MTAFRTPTDIGNRALQHLGAKQIDPVLGFTEQSRNAKEVSSCYDKLREAELQRRNWTFAIRRQVLRALDVNTMLLTPSLWQPGTTYFVGSIVADQVGGLWISKIPNNLGFDPLLTTVWRPYFGPLSVSLYDATTTYSDGELVYTAPGDGTYRVYQSTQSANADNPATGTPYSATTVYFKNQVVTLASVPYMSLIDLNMGNTPSAAPLAWNPATTYALGNQVAGSDGVIYTSVAGGNIGNDPTLTAPISWTNTGVLSPWTSVFVGGVGSAKWLQIGGKEFPSGVALSTLNIVYPLGSGPVSQNSTRNAFLLPAGYLRKAPQNPKSGIGRVGGPTNIGYDDWLIEGEFIITGDTGPIALRFVANITDVSRMHTLFCESVAVRIGYAICDTITQDKGQLQLMAKIYNEWKQEAATFDGIEDGWADSPQDDLITVRL